MRLYAYALLLTLAAKDLAAQSNSITLADQQATPHYFTIKVPSTLSADITCTLGQTGFGSCAGDPANGVTIINKTGVRGGSPPYSFFDDPMYVGSLQLWADPANTAAYAYADDKLAIRGAGQVVISSGVTGIPWTTPLTDGFSPSNMFIALDTGSNLIHMKAGLINLDGTTIFTNDVVPPFFTSLKIGASNRMWSEVWSNQLGSGDGALTILGAPTTSGNILLNPGNPSSGGASVIVQMARVDQPAFRIKNISGTTTANSLDIVDSSNSVVFKVIGSGDSGAPNTVSTWDIAPMGTSGTKALGNSTHRWSKVWAVDLDVSGVITAPGIMTTNTAQAVTGVKDWQANITFGTDNTYFVGTSAKQAGVIYSRVVSSRKLQMEDQGASTGLFWYWKPTISGGASPTSQVDLIDNSGNVVLAMAKAVAGFTPNSMTSSMHFTPSVTDTLTLGLGPSNRWKEAYIKDVYMGGGAYVVSGVGHFSAIDTGGSVTFSGVGPLSGTSCMQIDSLGVVGNTGLPCATTGIWTPSGSDIYFTGGKVGIGNSATPPADLTVFSVDTTSRPGFSIRQTGATAYGYDFDTEVVSSGRLDVYGVTAGLRTHSMSIMRNTGWVGIRSQSPTSELHVAGRITGAGTSGSGMYASSSTSNAALYATNSTSGPGIESTGPIWGNTGSPTGSVKLGDVWQPQTDNIVDLGDNTHRFRGGYLSSVLIASAASGGVLNVTTNNSGAMATFANSGSGYGISDTSAAGSIFAKVTVNGGVISPGASGGIQISNNSATATLQLSNAGAGYELVSIGSVGSRIDNITTALIKPASSNYVTYADHIRSLQISGSTTSINCTGIGVSCGLVGGSNDTRGRFQVSGLSTSGGSSSVTLTFGSAFTVAPYCTTNFLGGGAGATSVSTTSLVFTVVNNGSVGAVPGAYICIQ